MKKWIKSISLFILIVILNSCAKGIMGRKPKFLPELKPTHEQLNSLKIKKTIILSIHQTYYNPYGEGMVLQLPLEKELKTLFNYAGLTLSNSEEDKKAMLCNIKIEGYPYFGKYSINPLDKTAIRATHYTGANVFGEISIIDKKVTVYRKNFQGIIPAKSTISKSAFVPYQAPFFEALTEHNSCFMRIIEILYEVYNLDIITLLKDKHDYVRKNAVFSLGNIEVPNAVKILMKTLNDENHEMRVAAIKALGEKQDPRAIEALLNILDSDMWYSASLALRKQSGKNYMYKRHKYKIWWQKNKNKYLKKNKL